MQFHLGDGFTIRTKGDTTFERLSLLNQGNPFSVSLPHLFKGKFMRAKPLWFHFFCLPYCPLPVMKEIDVSNMIQVWCVLEVKVQERDEFQICWVRHEARFFMELTDSTVWEGFTRFDFTAESVPLCYAKASTFSAKEKSPLFVNRKTECCRAHVITLFLLIHVLKVFMFLVEFLKNRIDGPGNISWRHHSL